MLLFFKRLLLVCTAALLLSQATFGFALLGPRDVWQINALGYDPQGDNGDLGGPKNLGEEWRWVLPEITYAFDASFIDFFGTNGVAAVDEAVFLFNREMVNLSGLTDAQLRAKPLHTKRVHSAAQALGLLDLKTLAMGTLAEQLGLASAERWTWTLRDRGVIANNVTNYLVIKRNFDPFTLKPSSYVNGQRFTYEIGLFPTAIFAADFEDAVEYPIDQAGAIPGSTVSSLVGEDLTGFPLGSGEYFSALSQDDVGGLRYIYRLNNVNAENLPLPTRDVAAFAPSIRAVDTNALTFIQGIDAFSFFTNALFTDPATLALQFTNLQILATNVSITNIVTTTFVVTNLVSSTLFTNTSLLTLITNLDLYQFSEDSRLSDPNLLQLFYPQLIITKTNSTPVLEVTEFFFLTNSPYGSIGDPPIIATNLVTNIVANYTYEYANVITNYASAVTDLEIWDIQRARFSTPLDFIFETNITSFRTNRPSGGFYILDRSTNANLVAYAFSNEFNVPLLRTTNIFQNFSLIYFLTNFFDPTDIRLRLQVNQFTNVVYAAYPVFLNGSFGQQTVPVLTTNQVVRFDYAFGTNLLIFPPGNGNTNVILQTIVFTNGMPIRITETNVLTDIPRGTVLILDPDQFVLAGPRIETFGLVTNIISSFTNAVTGEFITQQLIFQTNTIQFAVFPVVFIQSTTPTLRAGVDTLQFRRQPFLDYLSQGTTISTNLYTISAITNGVRYFQTVRRVTGADIIFAADDLGTTTTAAFPVSYGRLVNFQSIGSPPALVGVGTQFDGGPGMIVGGATITFSKLVPSFRNRAPGALSEENSFLILAWGSFDSRTLTPRVYPEDITGQLQTLEDIVRRRNPAP